MSEELKPCPRCGSRAFVTIQFGVMCKLDRCLLLPPRANRVEAIAAWNTRASAAHIERIEALNESYREALGRIAELTDIEADFDGFEARRIARAALAKAASLKADTDALGQGRG